MIYTCRIETTINVERASSCTRWKALVVCLRDDGVIHTVGACSRLQILNMRMDVSERTEETCGGHTHRFTFEFPLYPLFPLTIPLDYVEVYWRSRHG